MRLDRAITLGVANPLLTLFRSLRTPRSTLRAADRVLPILMYHSISDDPEPGVRPYYRTTTSPEQFAGQMRWLRQNGWQGVTLSQGLTWLDSPFDVGCSMLDVGCSSHQEPQERDSPAAILHSQPPSLPVAITFDDGFQDFHTAAAPALRESGFRATMYLPTAFIGDARCQFRPCRGAGLSTLNSQPSTTRDCLTWAEVEELHRDGFEFGSHTVNHPRLVDLSWAEIQSEISNSRSEIEHRLGAPVSSFAYPYAFPQTNREFTRRLKATLVETGYTCCVTTRIGRAHPGEDHLLLPRLPVNSADDASLLRAKLAGAYDWLAPVQSGFKKVKRVLRSDRRQDR